MPETLTFHRLRHGAASYLLNENVPVPVVSRYLGHANPGITMKVYAHVLDGTSHGLFIKHPSTFRDVHPECRTQSDAFIHMPKGSGGASETDKTLESA
jgi:site-specific recombinase XerC